MGRGLSKLQHGILDFLATLPEPEGNLITVGYARPKEIIDALGGDRTPAQYASVSKALKRLEQRGLIRSVSGQVASQGKGYRYRLA